MKRIIISLSLCLFAVMATSAQNFNTLNRFMTKYSQTWAKPHGFDGDGASKQLGKPMPAFYLNRRYNSKSLKGKYVVLNFWATWCSGCRLLSVDLDSLMIKPSNEFRDVQLIGVDAYENATKGYDAVKWWKDKGIGFPNVGGKGADDCCKSVNGGHPCMMLIDDKGIVRGRWDAWTPSSAEEVRLAVWALHIIPRDGIKADVATVNKYYDMGRHKEALYLMELMPNELYTTALHFKVLAAENGDSAIAYLNTMRKLYEKDKPTGWETWKADTNYVKAIKDIAEWVRASNIQDPIILKSVTEALSSVINCPGAYTHHTILTLNVLRYIYGNALINTARQRIQGEYEGYSRQKDIPRADRDELNGVMSRYGIEHTNTEERDDFTYKRMMAESADEKAHKEMAFVTTEATTPANSKVTAKMETPRTVEPNKSYLVEVYVTVVDGWHAYADNTKNRKKGNIPTTMKLSLPKGFKLDGAMKVENHGADADQYTGTIYFAQNIKSPSEKQLRKLSNCDITATVEYQVCDSGSCIPPAEIEMKAKVNVK